MYSMDENLYMYIDHEKYAKDLKISGNFLITKYGVFEYLN